MSDAMTKDYRDMTVDELQARASRGLSSGDHWGRECVSELARRAGEAESRDVGSMEHRGNTVDYIYDKAKCYGDQVLMAFKALRELGWDSSECRDNDDRARSLEEFVASQPRRATFEEAYAVIALSSGHGPFMPENEARARWVAVGLPVRELEVNEDDAAFEKWWGSGNRDPGNPQQTYAYAKAAWRAARAHARNDDA